MDFKAKKAELVTDALALGYADLLAAEDYQTVADLLGAPGRQRVPYVDMSKDLFVAVFAAVVDEISYETNPDKRWRWTWRNNELDKMNIVSVPALAVMLAEFETDGYADSAAAKLCARGLLPPGTTGQQLLALLSTYPASRAQAIGWDNATADDVRNAWVGEWD